MTQCTELWVDRNNLRHTRAVARELPQPGPGEILLAIDQFGLTANNVTYAVVGAAVGYWAFYPAEGEWGRVPVWGCATVVASRCAALPVGERLWGFFPMASHVVLRPGPVGDDQFVEASEHRQALPGLYNVYRRTRADPEFLRAMEVERCLLFPLFATSYLLYDYLLANACFGAGQVLIGSVSSRTGYGLASLLRRDANVSQRIVGLTSPRNVAFVERLGCCDAIVPYGEEARVDATVKAAYIDMSGDARLTTALHRRLGENMVQSAMVGATHWENGGDTRNLPGAAPTFFFAPSHIARRELEWGPGEVMRKAMTAAAGIAQGLQGALAVEWTRDIAGLNALWLDLLDNQVSPRRGLMVSLLQD